MGQQHLLCSYRPLTLPALPLMTPEAIRPLTIPSKFSEHSLSTRDTPWDGETPVVHTPRQSLMDPTLSTWPSPPGFCWCSCSDYSECRAVGVAVVVVYEGQATQGKTEKTGSAFADRPFAGFLWASHLRSNLYARHVNLQEFISYTTLLRKGFF